MKYKNSCGPGSCGCDSGARSFLTKDEKIDLLNEHKEAIEKEVQGISEHIAELKKSK